MILPDLIKILFNKPATIQYQNAVALNEVRYRTDDHYLCTR